MESRRKSSQRTGRGLEKYFYLLTISVILKSYRYLSVRKKRFVFLETVEDAFKEIILEDEASKKQDKASS